MKNHNIIKLIGLYQGVGRAFHTAHVPQSANEATTQRGLPSAKLAAKVNPHGGLTALSQSSPKIDGAMLIGQVNCEFDHICHCASVPKH